jgi:hypothetical protein
MGRHKVYTTEFIEKEAEALEEWIKTDEFLFLEDFSFLRGYTSKRMREWRDENEKFAAAYARAKDRQVGLITRGGLSGKFNPQYCMFTAKNVLRWTDKTIVVQEQQTEAIAPEAYNTSKDPVNDRASRSALET